MFPLTPHYFFLISRNLNGLPTVLPFNLLYFPGLTSSFFWFPFLQHSYNPYKPLLSSLTVSYPQPNLSFLSCSLVHHIFPLLEPSLSSLPLSYLSLTSLSFHLLSFITFLTFTNLTRFSILLLYWYFFHLISFNTFLLLPNLTYLLCHRPSLQPNLFSLSSSFLLHLFALLKPQLPSFKLSYPQPNFSVLSFLSYYTFLHFLTCLSTLKSHSHFCHQPYLLMHHQRELVTILYEESEGGVEGVHESNHHGHFGVTADALVQHGEGLRACKNGEVEG